MSQHRSGPVRSAVARDAILTATARLFVEVGYEHLTIEAIARAAKVGKQTIYRWWPSRGAIIADCLVEGHFFAVDMSMPNTGDVHADFSSWVDATVEQLDAPTGQNVLRSLVAAAAEEEAVGQHLNEALGLERHFVDRLNAAIDTGELPSDAPVEYIGQALFGILIVRGLGRLSIEAAPMRMLVDQLLSAPRP